MLNPLSWHKSHVEWLSLTVCLSVCSWSWTNKYISYQDGRELMWMMVIIIITIVLNLIITIKVVRCDLKIVALIVLKLKPKRQMLSVWPRQSWTKPRKKGSNILFISTFRWIHLVNTPKRISNLKKKTNSTTTSANLREKSISDETVFLDAKIGDFHSCVMLHLRWLAQM